MYDIVKLRKVLTTEEYRVIDDDGKCLPPSNEIYKRISETMDGNPSAKHVYIIVKNNRNRIHDAVLAYFSLSSSITERDKKDTSFEPNISISKSGENFFLKFSSQDWQAMNQQDILYEDGRTYTIFQPGWTDIFAKNIWMQRRISCPWTFKNAKTSRQKNYYCRVRACCTECHAKLTCTLIYEPNKDDNDISFKCVMKNANPNYVHEKRRPLRGRRRSLIANTLVDTKTDAITYIRSEAKHLMDFGDPYPPILPKTTVLRKAISEMKDKRLGLTGSKSISNIVDMKDTTHVGSVHKIGASPFFCYYWTTEQKLLYKLNYKTNEHSFMTIDATGSVVKKIKYSYTKSSHIFLYQCMSVSHMGSVPVFQMLSAEQDTVAISTWLLKIVSTGVPIPRVVVCDFSQALLISISIAFAHKRNLNDYMQNCYDVVTGKSQILPATYIRLDVSHLVAIICRWDCLKRHPLPKIRQFFIRSLCQAHQMQNLQDLEYFLESILIVAMSENIGTVHGENIESQTRYVYVTNVIKGLETKEEDIENEHVTFDEIDLETDCHTGWREWTKIIYERASATIIQCTNGDVLNAFHNIEIANKIKKLMHYLPIWTNIMSPFFKLSSTVATSSSVEAEFANIKVRVFKNELPLRVDKFIKRHIDYLDGRVKEASANIYTITSKNVDKEQKNSNIKRSIDEEDNASPNNSTNAVISLNKYEDWGGLGNSHTSKKKKPNYLDACPDWDYVQSHNVVNIPVLKNGNLCESVRVEGTYISVKETCSFDSLLQLIMHAVGKERQYKAIVQDFRREHSVIQLSINILNRGKLIMQDYVTRAKILSNLNIFTQSSTRNVKFINANCNIAHLIDILFTEMPSITRTKICSNCDYTQSRYFPTLNINIGMIIDDGLGVIQKAIDDTKLDKNYMVKCAKCNGIISSKVEYGPHIFLDTSLITDPNYKRKGKFESTLDSITKSITLNDNCYTLSGIIDYKYYENSSNENINNGHYIAIAFTGMHWYEYDDLQKTKNYISSQKTITPHVIMYVK